MMVDFVEYYSWKIPGMWYGMLVVWYDDAVWWAFSDCETVSLFHSLVVWYVSV